MTLPRTLARVAVGATIALAALAVTPTASAPLAVATASSASTAGYCPDATGVTVVVDFSDLGDGIVVRCATGPVVAGYTGLDALQDAGFTVEGTRQSGLQFACRIQGRPAADEELPVEGDPDYTESCQRTPPASAYWGYWYANNRGTWRYSSSGASSRDAIRGGFEGWRFSLNHSTGNIPPPGVAPRRPGSTTTPPPSEPPSSPPTSSSGPGSPHSPSGGGGGEPPASQQPNAPGTSPGPTGPESSADTDGPRAESPSADAQTSQSGPRGSAKPSKSSPTSSTESSSSNDPVAQGETTDGIPVSGELPTADTSDESGGLSSSTVIGFGLVAALGAAAGFTAWRRSRQR